MTPWSSSTFDERSRSNHENWPTAHESPSGESLGHFGTSNSQVPQVQHELTLQATLHSYYTMDQSFPPDTSFSYDGCNSSSQLSYPRLDIYPAADSSSLTNFPPTNFNGPYFSPFNHTMSDPQGFMYDVYQQAPQSIAPQWLPRPNMGPNSGNGIMHIFHPCLWVERGVLCNVMVQGTRSQMNRHLRACHGFRGSETLQVRCHWVGCNESMQQGSVARHMVTCHLQAKVTCPRCFKKLSRADVLPKHQRVCPAANR